MDPLFKQLQQITKKSQEARAREASDAFTSLKSDDLEKREFANSVCALFASQEYLFDFVKFWNEQSLFAHMELHTDAIYTGQIPDELGWVSDKRIRHVLIIHGERLKQEKITIWLGIRCQTEGLFGEDTISLSESGEIVSNHKLKVMQMTIIESTFTYDWITECARNAYGE